MRRLAPALALALAATGAAHAQTLVPLANQPPDGASVGFLLTDGTVLIQGQAYADWWRLTPDATGSYQHGTWKQAASLPAGYAPLYFASAVLADGRVVIAGGEYNNGGFAFTNECAIYDPVADTWTKLSPPAGWAYIGDSPAAILPDGRFLVGRKFDKKLAALDPKTLKWQALPSTGKADIDAEEGWTLLPDGRVLTYDVSAAPNSEAYDASAKSWHTLGATPVVLKGPPYVKIVHYGHGQVYHPPGEVGPGILRPDGTVFATGATPKGGTHGFTALFDPKTNTWRPGPGFPAGIDAGDSAATLLPTGNVLVRGSDNQLYEFDGTNLKGTGLASATYSTIFMLPTGEALVSGTDLYRPAGKALAAAAPAITGIATTLARGQTYTLTGTQLNGVSQAASFGDEVETATNYPLVRLTNKATGHVLYARTHDHSTMAVATGATPVTTQVDIPAAAEPGPAKLEVVTNGIASNAVTVTIQ